MEEWHTTVAHEAGIKVKDRLKRIAGRFCHLKGNDEFFVEVDEDYIQDDFNLTGLSTQVRSLSVLLSRERQRSIQLFTFLVPGCSKFSNCSGSLAICLETAVLTLEENHLQFKSVGLS